MMTARWLALCLTLLALSCISAEAGTGAIEITAPWARATPPVAATGAAYLEIKTTAADTLLGATTAAAERVEIHATLDSNGVMQMRPVREVALLPGKPVSFAPASMHLMLIGLKGPLVEGKKVPLTLRFEHAGELTIQLDVRKDAPSAEHMHH